MGSVPFVLSGEGEVRAVSASSAGDGKCAEGEEGGECVGDEGCEVAADDDAAAGGGADYEHALVV